MVMVPAWHSLAHFTCKKRSTSFSFSPFPLILHWFTHSSSSFIWFHFTIFTMGCSIRSCSTSLTYVWHLYAFKIKLLRGFAFKLLPLSLSSSFQKHFNRKMETSFSLFFRVSYMYTNVCVCPCALIPTR